MPTCSPRICGPGAGGNEIAEEGLQPPAPLFGPRDVDPVSRPVRVEFDRGTLLLRGPGERALEHLPGVRWDPRVGCHRAPARFHAELCQALGARADERALAPQRPGRLSAPSLRPYQVAALDAWTLAGRRGVVVLPTGAGKTRVAVAAIAAAGCSAICLVPTRVLLAQWRVTLGRELGAMVGVLGDGERDLRAVTVATFESAWRHMASIGNRFEMLVADEAHHFGSGVRNEALEMCTAALRLGLTATPPAGEGRRRARGPRRSGRLPARDRGPDGHVPGRARPGRAPAGDDAG